MAVNEKVSPFVFKLVITEKVHVTKYCDVCKDLNSGNDDLVMPKLDLVLRAVTSFSLFDFDDNGNLSIYKRRSARLCFYWENKFQCVRNRVLTRYLDKFSRSKISEKKQNVHVILIKFWSEDVRRLVLQGRKMTDKFIKSLHNDTLLRFRSNELPMLCSSFKPTPFLHDCSNKYSCNNVLLWFGIHVYRHFGSIRFVAASISVCLAVDVCSFTVLGLEFEKFTKCNFNEYLVWFGSSGCVKEIIGFGLLNILIKYVDDSRAVSNWSCTTKYLRHVFLSIVSYLLMYVILIVLMENWFYEPP